MIAPPCAWFERAEATVTAPLLLHTGGRVVVEPGITFAHRTAAEAANTHDGSGRPAGISPRAEGGVIASVEAGGVSTSMLTPPPTTLGEQRGLNAVSEKRVCAQTLEHMGKGHLRPLLDKTLMSIEDLAEDLNAIARRIMACTLLIACDQ